ncbi:MAG TPA: amino acid adenylation domain-containing protein [Longimicrobiaceae bacterium]|nr:amino acid adenylation domain-containing protein [Longimicrobiaceae bacterium]
MTDLSKRLEQLSPAKRALLEKLGRQGTAAPAATAAVAARRKGGPVPLSSGQQRLWFLDRMEPGTPLYTIPAVYRLRGRVDPRALEQALRGVAERHEALRTVFRVSDGDPLQVVLPRGSFPLGIVDFRALSPAEREARVSGSVQIWLRAPFDLVAGPLARALLARTGDEEWIFALALHHIVSDGWSQGILFRELRALYAAAAVGEAPSLPAPALQYPDFAAWQREWLRGVEVREQLAWWRERLADLPPPLELPTDRPRPSSQSFRGAKHVFTLPGEVEHSLAGLARSEGATLFMALLAGFQLLLSRYTGTEDVVVGSPVAGRNRAETEGILGFFVNTLVLRTDLSGDPAFRGLLRRVRETTLGAYAHQDLPFERLVEELRPDRSLHHSPLFQVIFAFQNAPGESLSLAGVEAELVIGDLGVSIADLDFQIERGPAGLRTVIRYSTDLFDRATIERLSERYVCLLRGAAERPDRRVSAIPLVEEEERARVLGEWGRAPRSFEARPVHRLFADQAARTPAAVAVVAGDEQITYAELDRRANRLAHYLRARGVGPEVRVGICLERGPEMLAAVLGVLKAGGAYVPLDPSYPAERLAWILEDAAAPVLVTQESPASALPPHTADVVLLDADRERIDVEPGDEPDDRTGPESLAYVIYTSGSTGRPKGVLVEHASLANLVLAARERFGFEGSDLVPVLASYAFDIWAFESLVPLVSGGAVRVVAAEGVLDAEHLVDELRDATVVHAVPALMRVMVEAVRARGGETHRRLRLVFTGGDLVPADLLAGIDQALPGAEVHILYGPTEGTIVAASYAVREGEPPERHPVGRPLPNVSLYVCDSWGNALPDGIPGELFIGGAGVARGYLARPELTAEKFLPDPFGGRPGARLYRTGDRVCWNASGVLEFIGRVDEQVKVRGFRIEPGEVESVLARHPALREAAVLARRDGGGEARLVAYVAPAESPVSIRELRSFLAGRLPEYMVPTAFVFLESLPLTPTGKVDRLALPAPDDAAGEPAEHAEPRTPAEEILAGIWAEVLGVGRVGIHDNFFDLGGHSLRAYQAVSRVRAVLGVDLPVRALFEAPSVAGVAERIEAARREREGTAFPPLRPARRDGALPLSFAQERLWFLYRMEPESSAYNMPFVLRLRGKADVTALRVALNGLVARHESLRTVFSAADDVPVQRILPASVVPLPVEDLAALPEAEREPAVQERVEAEARLPFDLMEGPVFRARLLRLDADEHLLVVNMHHIVSDGWSMGVLFRELGSLYASLVEDRPSALPPLPVQYADFAVWQHEWLCGEVLERQVEWWRERLAGAPPMLELPTDRPRIAAGSRPAGRVRFAVPAETAASLRVVSRQEGSTVFTTALGAFQVLMARYSGEEDVVVGTPSAGRTHAELERVVGFFVNTLAMRAELGGNPTVREMLGRAKETVLGAHAYQDVPFERLVRELHPDRSAGRNPLFQVLLSYRNGAVDAPQLPGLTVSLAEVSPPSAKFDLSAELVDSPEGMSGALVYDAGLFDAATAERMAGHFVTLLEGIAARPDARVSELRLLAAGERRQVVEEWNDTAREYPRDASIHGLFSARAARNPGAVAVSFEGASLTYAELDTRADRLARLLRRRGIGPESRVGVCIERSPEMVVALLGILRAGGAYVPLDPSYPGERLRLMREDAAVGTVLTLARLRDRVPEPVEVVCLDALEDAPEDVSGPAAELDTAPDGLAYVMFTSGSTGRPKAVGVTHRNVVRLVQGAEYASFGPEEVFLQLAPLAFDASTLEIWGPLLNGGRLVIFPPVTPAPEEVAAVLRRERVTTLWLTAALFHRMVDECPGGLAPVRQLLAGGDVLSPAHVREFLRAHPRCRLINGYGPTENTTFSCCHTVACADGASIPIGRPITHSRAHVLDASGEPAPVGVPGELFVGGDGVARGYLRRPDLTAERFVPDPFSAEPGARLYRTGDRVRWRPDGALEFLGRVDRQVKVRGFRIEPGEVEAVLAGHPRVRDAAVVVGEDAAGERRLVGYAAPPEGEQVGTAELRAYLRERLPEHMVPAALVVLDALPLTPSGKIDRRALPAPDTLPDGEGTVEPRTPTEEIVAGIWADVLCVERVGIHDSFFDLGGHSLLATRIVSRVRSVLGVELPLRLLFEAPTVAALAAQVDRAADHVGGPPPPPVAPVPRDAPLPLSFSQQRLWFLDRMEPVNPYYNVPFALRLAGPLDAAVLESALRETVRRHESLRTVFRSTDARPEQVVLPGIPFSLLVEDLSSLPAPEREEAVRRLAFAETRLPFDLEAGPLFRARLLRLGEGEHVLLLTLHHIVSDAWSFGVLYREVSELYRAFARGEPSPLPEPAVQYADFAAWQREWLAGEALERQLDYWRGRLAGAPALLELPTDRPRPPVQTHDAGRHPFVLPAALAESLRALGRREGATLFMVLLAALDAVLRRYSGEDDVVVGTPIAGRTRAETEGMVGFFVNMLPLRVDLSGDPSFRELLGRVRETTLGAYAHQDVPFERVIEELRIPRSLSHSAVYQVAIVLHNTARNRIDIPGVEVEPVDVFNGLSAFDLALGATETAEGIACGLIFNTGLFDEATVEAMGRMLRQVLERAAADPARPLSRLSELLDDERRLIFDWSAAAGELPSAPVHERFRLQAGRTPDAPAVLQEGAEPLTYAELDRRSDRLARVLLRLGVAPETRVGICLERSPEMLVALLGVLKAGGAYVPLDPAYPAERLAYMLRDSGARVLLTHSVLRHQISATGVHLVCLDEAAPGGLPLTGDGPAPEVPFHPENGAYVIYTSGSTGKPKGVLVPHRALARYASAAAELYGITPADRVLQFASLSFDASAEEIYPALLGGAALVLRTGEMLASAATFLERVERWGVTVLDLPTAYWHELVAELQRGAARLPACVRLVIIGGERALPERVADWQRLVGGAARLVNTYGPTEATVVATLADLTDNGAVPAPAEPPLPPVPIGAPVPNARVYALDSRMEPVPVGARGELYIGGAGVARGYLGQPERTAERFVPDPFSGEAGARLYRSGDVVRWRREGVLEYLGRMDEQVKVRGFRIEPGEIESVLLRHPRVREAVVVAREDEPGRVRLVGYVVAEGEVPTTAELRAQVKGELPEHLVPGAFVVLAVLPKTGSGKVDRRALPAPEGVGAREEYLAPRTAVEAGLAEIWAEVLGAERVGVEENFFELGGHSLLATQVVVRVRQRWGVEVPLRAVFEHPTVAGLALLLPRDAGPAEASPEVERIGGAASGLEDGLLGRLDELSDAEVERLLAGLSPDGSFA